MRKGTPSLIGISRRSPRKLFILLPERQELCALYAAGHDRPGGIAKLYDLLMDVGFNSAAAKASRQ